VRESLGAALCVFASPELEALVSTAFPCASVLVPYRTGASIDEHATPPSIEDARNIIVGTFMGPFSERNGRSVNTHDQCPYRPREQLHIPSQTYESRSRKRARARARARKSPSGAHVYILSGSPPNHPPMMLDAPMNVRLFSPLPIVCDRST